MAKLKPISKPEELAAIPTNEPVLVLLEPPATGSEEGAPDPKPVQKDEPDDGAKQLQARLEEQQNAVKLERERREAAEQREREAREETERERRRATAAVSERNTSEYDLMTGSLASAQAELAAAQTEYRAAYDAADGAAQAAAMAKISRASGKVLNFESAIAELDARRERQTKEPQQEQRQPQAIDIVTAINTNPKLMPEERMWLLAHQDAYGPRNDELNLAYQRAMKKGLSRGTSDYFKFLNEFMEYEQPQNGSQESGGQERSTAMSAPVSRDNTSMNGGRSPDRVELTPDERALAQSMGISDIAYARQKIALQQDKKARPEAYGQRG